MRENRSGNAGVPHEDKTHQKNADAYKQGRKMIFPLLARAKTPPHHRRAENQCGKCNARNPELFHLNEKDTYKQTQQDGWQAKEQPGNQNISRMGAEDSQAPQNKRTKKNAAEDEWCCNPHDQGCLKNNRLSSSIVRLRFEGHGSIPGDRLFRPYRAEKFSGDGYLGLRAARSTPGCHVTGFQPWRFVRLRNSLRSRLPKRLPRLRKSCSGVWSTK